MSLIGSNTYGGLPNIRGDTDGDFDNITCQTISVGDKLLFEQPDATDEGNMTTYIFQDPVTNDLVVNNNNPLGGFKIQYGDTPDTSILSFRIDPFNQKLEYPVGNDPEESITFGELNALRGAYTNVSIQDQINTLIDVTAGGGYWGTFYSDIDQYAATSNTATVATLNNFDPENDGLALHDPVTTITGTNYNSVLVLKKATYNIQICFQISSTSASSTLFRAWFRVNGTDIPASSAGMATKDNNGYDIVTFNVIMPLDINDVVTLMWASSATGQHIEHLPAQSSPYTCPLSPSVYLSFQQVTGYVDNQAVVDDLETRVITLEGKTTAQTHSSLTSTTTFTGDIICDYIVATEKYVELSGTTFLNANSATNISLAWNGDYYLVKLPSVLIIPLGKTYTVSLRNQILTDGDDDFISLTSVNNINQLFSLGGALTGEIYLKRYYLSYTFQCVSNTASTTSAAWVVTNIQMGDEQYALKYTPNIYTGTNVFNNSVKIKTLGIDKSASATYAIDVSGGINITDKLYVNGEPFSNENKYGTASANTFLTATSPNYWGVTWAGSFFNMVLPDVTLGVPVGRIYTFAITNILPVNQSISISFNYTNQKILSNNGLVNAIDLTNLTESVSLMCVRTTPDVALGVWVVVSFNYQQDNIMQNADRNTSTAENAYYGTNTYSRTSTNGSGPAIELTSGSIFTIGGNLSVAGSTISPSEIATLDGMSVNINSAINTKTRGVYGSIGGLPVGGTVVLTAASANNLALEWSDLYYSVILPAVSTLQLGATFTFTLKNPIDLNEEYDIIRIQSGTVALEGFNQNQILTTGQFDLKINFSSVTFMCISNTTPTVLTACWVISNIQMVQNEYIYTNLPNTFNEQTNVNGPITINQPLALNNNIIANTKTITPAEVGFLDGVTSNIQTQLNAIAIDINAAGNNTFTGINTFENQVVLQTNSNFNFRANTLDVTVGNGYFQTPASSGASIILTYPYSAITNWYFSNPSIPVSVVIGRSGSIWNSFTFTFPNPSFIQYLSWSFLTGISTLDLKQDITFSQTGDYLLEYYTLGVGGTSPRFLPLEQTITSNIAGSSLLAITSESVWCKQVMRFRIATAGVQTLKFTGTSNSTLTNRAITIYGVTIKKCIGLNVSDGDIINNQLIDKTGITTTGIYNRGDIWNFGNTKLFGGLELYTRYTTASTILSNSSYGSIIESTGGRSVAIGTSSMKLTRHIQDAICIGVEAGQNIGTSISYENANTGIIAIGFRALREFNGLVATTSSSLENIFIGNNAGRNLNITSGIHQYNAVVGSNTFNRAGSTNIQYNALFGHNIMATSAAATSTIQGNSVFGNNSFQLARGANNTSCGYNNFNLGTNTATNNNSFFGANVCNTQSGASNVMTNCSFFGSNTDVSVAGNYSNSTCLGYNSRITASNQIILGTAAEVTFAIGGLNIPASMVLTLLGNILANSLTITPVQLSFLSNVVSQKLPVTAISGGNITETFTFLTNPVFNQNAIQPGAVMDMQTRFPALENGNTNLGFESNLHLDDGYFNTAIGSACLLQAVTIYNNTGVGYASGQNILSGESTCVGAWSGQSNITGDGTFLGKGTSGVQTFVYGSDGYWLFDGVSTFTFENANNYLFVEQSSIPLTLANTMAIYDRDTFEFRGTINTQIWSIPPLVNMVGTYTINNYTQSRRAPNQYFSFTASCNSADGWMTVHSTTGVLKQGMLIWHSSWTNNALANFRGISIGNSYVGMVTGTGGAGTYNLSNTNVAGNIVDSNRWVAWEAVYIPVVTVANTSYNKLKNVTCVGENSFVTIDNCVSLGSPNTSLVHGRRYIMRTCPTTITGDFDLYNENIFYSTYLLSLTANITIRFPLVYDHLLGTEIRFRRIGGTTTFTVSIEAFNLQQIVMNLAQPLSTTFVAKQMMAANTYSTTVCAIQHPNPQFGFCWCQV